MPLRVFIGNSYEKYSRFANHPSMSQHAFIALNVVVLDIDTSHWFFVAQVNVSLRVPIIIIVILIKLYLFCSKAKIISQGYK